jgi:hypothetical protein
MTVRYEPTVFAYALNLNHNYNKNSNNNGNRERSGKESEYAGLQSAALADNRALPSSKLDQGGGGVPHWHSHLPVKVRVLS